MDRAATSILGRWMDLWIGHHCKIVHPTCDDDRRFNAERTWRDRLICALPEPWQWVIDYLERHHD